MDTKKIDQVIEMVKGLTTSELICTSNKFFNQFENDGVIFLPEGFNKVRAIEVFEICYLQIVKNKIEIRLKNEVILYDSSSTDLLDYLEENNKDFKYVNNGIMVNLANIKMYDSYYRKVYFSHTNKDIYADATKAAIDKIIRFAIGKEKDIVGKEKLETEYSPNRNRVFS